MTLLDTIVSPETGTRQGHAARAALSMRETHAVWSARTFLLTAGGLFLLLAAGFCHWAGSNTVVPWDSKNHFYPMFRFLADALRHGTLPLWNPYHFSGYPSIADPQSLIFTPSMMLFALIAPGASMTTFDAVILGHLFLGGLGVLMLGRRWGWHPAAAFLAALVFVMGGSAAGRLEHTGMIISYIYFPWALWALQGALQRRSLPWAVLAGLAITLMALGRDQVAFLLCVALAGAVLREALGSRAPLNYLLNRSPILLCTGLVTIACMIVPILLTLQFVHDSNRPSITYGVALSGSLNPVNLLTLIAPDVFGTLDKVYDYWGPGTGLIAGNDWTDKTDRTIDYLFIGTVPCVLLIWHGLAAGRLLERGARFFTALCLAALLYAFGRYTPVFGLIFDWVPGVSLYRRPADASFPVTIALAFGAGYVLQRFIADGLPRSPIPLPRWLPVTGRQFSGRSPLPPLVINCAAAATLLGCALLIGGGLAFAHRYGHARDTLTQVSLAGLSGCAVAMTLLVFRKPNRRAFIATVLVAVTAGELLALNTASAVNAEPISTYSAYSGLYPAEAAGLAVLRADLARRAAKGERPRIELIGVNGSWQNASMVLKLEDTIGYNPLRISDYERAVGPHESATEIDQRQFPGLFRGYTGRLASLLGLDYLVLDRPIDKLPRHFPRPAADLLFAGQGFYVYRLINDLTPRAYIAPHVSAVDHNAVLSDETMPDFDPPNEALIDTADAASLAAPLLQAATVPASEKPAARPLATITSYEDNAVTISAETAAPGILVLHDLYYPGWTAQVDGKPAPVLRANILFRGVQLDPGHHVVTFRFEPLRLANLAAAAGSLLRAAK
jgi:hypothetical protein